MKISGFTFVKNVSKLYYPIKESISSILPIVDEYVIALGEGDKDDNTRELIESIKSPKIKIIDTIWDTKAYPDGMENAHQTDIACEACSGDWLFYLQADEVVHDKFLPIIKKRCEDLINDTEIEGLLFKYRHFFGDYWHFLNSHNWYPREIRIIRNGSDIHSWQSAQSFRRIPNFDGKSYRQKEGSFKLKVASVDAYVYHYGWVRPPRFMQNKKKALDTIHKGESKVEEIYKDLPDEFDYGPLGKLPKFNETHPEVMKEWIKGFDWENKLNYGSVDSKDRIKHKHEKWKSLYLTYIEQEILGGKQIFGYSNWKLIRR